jgi:AmmeMemoRadiSam system protein B
VGRAQAAGAARGGLTRAPVVAGLFYPAEPHELARTVDALLGERARSAWLRALVAPHAGYVYSGPIAASAFRLAPREARVLLLGPSHFVPLEGFALSSADAWATPLGEVPVDDGLRAAALDAGVRVDDHPHARDHALEVELPFLQRACSDGLSMLPIAVGTCPPEAVAALIAALEALVVVSTDLSHYFDDATARQVDRNTADAVLARDPDAIRDDAACGVFALRGLVEHARRSGSDVELLDLRTSAEIAGDPERVVGYGAFAMRDQPRVA